MSNLTAYSPYFVEEEDEDDDVDQVLKGDPHSKDSKLATERLNFVALCDAFPLMDPHNLLDAYYTCDRDLEQSIDFVREMTDVEAAHLGITSETKVDYSTILCSFFDLNKFCSYGCPYYHDYLGVRCPYYDPEHKVCPYGADCIFLHTTEEEQRRRLDALQKKHEAANPEEEEEEEEDSSDTFDNTYFVAPHVVDFTQEQEDYLYELYTEFETVPAVIINAILHFIVFKKMDMKIANVILEKYFSGPFGKEHPLSDTPKWPEPLFTRNEGLKSRHKETFRTACILAAMRNIHIEQGIEAYAVKKKASTVRRHMASAWAYQSKLVNYVTSVAAALFAPPRSEFCTVSLAPYVTRRMDKILDYSYLAAVDIKRSIMKTPSPENSAIYFFNDSGEKRLDTFKSIISGDGFKTGYGRLESLFISSDGKVVFALFNYKK